MATLSEFFSRVFGGGRPTDEMTVLTSRVSKLEKQVAELMRLDRSLDG